MRASRTTVLLPARRRMLVYVSGALARGDHESHSLASVRLLLLMRQQTLLHSRLHLNTAGMPERMRSELPFALGSLRPYPLRTAIVRSAGRIYAAQTSGTARLRASVPRELQRPLLAIYRGRPPDDLDGNRFRNGMPDRRFPPLTLRLQSVSLPLIRGGYSIVANRPLRAPFLRGTNMQLSSFAIVRERDDAALFLDDPLIHCFAGIRSSS